MEERAKTQAEMSAREHTKEDEFFRKEEEELKRKAEAEKAQREAEELKKLHYMRCPKCGQELVEEPHAEIMVDRCKACGGVWLDAGEMERLNKKEPGLLSRLFG